VIKYKYICQIKYTEAILSNSTRKLLWFKITKTLIAVKNKFLVVFILIFGTLSFSIRNAYAAPCREEYSLRDHVAVVKFTQTTPTVLSDRVTH